MLILDLIEDMQQNHLVIISCREDMYRDGFVGLMGEGKLIDSWR